MLDVKSLLYIELLLFIVMILESSHLYLTYRNLRPEEIIGLIIIILYIQFLYLLIHGILLLISWIYKKCIACCCSICLAGPFFALEVLAYIANIVFTFRLSHKIHDQLQMIFQDQLRLTLIVLFLILKGSLIIYFYIILGMNFSYSSSRLAFQKLKFEKIEF